MAKVVVLKLCDGNFQDGFNILLQVSEDGKHPFIEISGKLPPAPEIPQLYQQWQSIYIFPRFSFRKFKVSRTLPSNVSIKELTQALKNHFNYWLNANRLCPLKEQLVANLNSSELIRFIIVTEDWQLRQIPWHLWDLFENYPQAEVAFASPNYEQIRKVATSKDKVRILAILGNSEGIDVGRDRLLIEHLPNTETTFLVEPKQQDINEQLCQQDWDILFFAGHSYTKQEKGYIYINETDILTMNDLQHGLRNSIERGLQLAIFNSCDGLGLAKGLEALNIPQSIVMRERIPDPVAPSFLKYFLDAFTTGQSLYLSVRIAREGLQDDGWDDKIPGITWLPAIFQNLAEIPPTWKELEGYR